MNQKELNELRRHMAPNKCGISKIYGCFVSGSKEVISYIQDSLGLMTEFESEKFLATLKKVLSGTLGKNLIDLSFTTQQVMDGPEHKRLSDLRKSKLEDPFLREDFFRAVIDSVDLDGAPYLILLAHDTYDVPYRGKDGEDQADAGDTVFSYILCAICPVKEEKPELAYAPDNQTFHTRGISQILSAPELGFLFPAFDDRSANIYKALFYTRKNQEGYDDFVDAIFHTQRPLPAAQQRETFQEILSDTLSSDCSYEVLQGIHAQFREQMEAHKESRDPDPLQFSIRDLGGILRESGVAEAQVTAFESSCQEQLGEDAALPPANLLDSKHFTVETPKLRITIDPDSSHLIQTRIIGGRKYILIPAEDQVEVNGVPIQIPAPGEDS